MTHTQPVGGADSIQIWMVAVKVLKKQLRTGEKFSAFSIGSCGWANKMIDNVMECYVGRTLWTRLLKET
jgi:hypothetical protein